MDDIITIFLKVFTISVARYFMIAGIPFFIFYRLFRGWFEESKIQRGKAKKTDFLREILHSLQTTFVLTGIGVLILRTPFKQFTKVYTDITDYPIWWIFASTAIALVIHDSYFYWMHYLLHHPKIFKSTHLVHHKSTNPSPFASYSFHFVEAWTEGAVLLLIVLFVPMHLFSIMLFVLIGFAINVYGHLGYEIAPLWFRKTWLFDVFNTSVYHNLHHSKFKGNYGLYFRFWDRLMKTELPGYAKEYDRIQQNRLKAKSKNGSRMADEQAEMQSIVK